jgi:hypothetical protein
LAFPSVKANIDIYFAFNIVPTPIVIADLGTFSIPKNEEAASDLVLRSKVTSLVNDFMEEPGSLKPI